MGGVATKQIVVELSKDLGEPGLHGSQRIFGMVLDAIRDLSIFNIPTWYMQELPLNSYNGMCWPDSCVIPLMVTIRRNNREFALSVSDELVNNINSLDKTGCTILDADREIQDFFRIDGFNDYWNPIFNWGLGEIYGLKSSYGGVGFVTHNKELRMSYINGATLQSDDTFCFYFKSDGITKENVKFVPTECKEAIEYFVLRKYFRIKNPSLSEMNLKNYKEEFYRLQRLYEGDTAESWTDAMASNTISSPKL